MLDCGKSRTARHQCNARQQGVRQFEQDWASIRSCHLLFNLMQPVGKRFGNVGGIEVGTILEISDGARNSQNSVIGAG